MKKLPGGFSETLTAHMKRLGISSEQLAARTLVSLKTVQRLMKEEEYSSNLKTIVAICIELKLPPEVSSDLMRKAGLVFKCTKEHSLLQILVNSFYNSTLYECNEILKMNGYRTRKEEIRP
jgi:DNA-binding Xre family transcriptional regulator